MWRAHLIVPVFFAALLLGTPSRAQDDGAWSILFSVSHGLTSEPVAAPAADASQEQRLTEVLKLAHRVRPNDAGAFLAALQSVAELLPETPVATEPGNVPSIGLKLNIHNRGVDGLRFRVPKGKPRDLVWCFVIPPGWNYVWNIAPVTDRLPGGFKNYHCHHEYVPDPTDAVTGVRKEVVVLQFLAAENLEPGREYILWFDFKDSGVAEVEISVACLEAGDIPDSDVAIAEALGRRRIADALRRSAVSGRDRDWFNANKWQNFTRALRKSDAEYARAPEDPEVVRRRHFILRRLKRWKEAEQFGVKEAIPIAEKSGNKELLFWVLWNQVWLIWEDDHADRTPGNSRRLKAYNGTELAERVLALAEELDSDNLRFRAFYMYAAWVEHSLAGHQWDKAIEYYRKAMTVAQRNAWGDRVSDSMGGVAEVLACINRLDDSVEWSRQAGRRPHPFVAVRRRKWREIYDRRRAGIDYLERETLRQPNERLQREVIGWNQRGPYDNTAIACMHLSKQQEAVEIVERLNNRTLGMILGAGAAKSRSHSVARLRREQAEVKQKMARLHGRIRIARERESERTISSLQRDLDIQAAALDRIGTDIAVEELQVKASGMPPPMTVPEMQALLDEDSALLLYGVTWMSFVKDGIVATLTRNAFRSRLRNGLTIGNSEKQGLQPHIDPYVALLAKPKRTAAEEAELKKRNDYLYNLLIAPIRENIEDRRHWIVIPSGPLCQVPIHLLRDENGRPLIEKHTISYVPSVGVLRYALARNRKVGGNATVVANPALPEQGASLRFAETEARSVAEAFPSANLLLGDRATETAVKEALAQADVFHFACHGLLNTDFPMKSSLALTPDDANDGLLTAREICDYPVKAGLVVLSACQSGSGAMSAGWIELVGMSRAWLLAGAPSVIVSLWKIDDKATSELMAEFYRNLKTMGRAEALQRAQLEMMKRYENPYYWGAFVLFGDYR